MGSLRRIGLETPVAFGHGALEALGEAVSDGGDCPLRVAFVHWDTKDCRMDFLGGRILYAPQQV